MENANPTVFRRSRLCYGVASVCRLWRYVLWLNGASKSKSYYWLPIGSRISFCDDWYQNEWPWPLFRGRIKVMSAITSHSTLNIAETVIETEAWFGAILATAWLLVCLSVCFLTYCNVSVCMVYHRWFGPNRDGHGWVGSVHGSGRVGLSPLMPKNALCSNVSKWAITIPAVVGLTGGSYRLMVTV